MLTWRSGRRPSNGARNPSRPTPSFGSPMSILPRPTDGSAARRKPRPRSTACISSMPGFTVQNWAEHQVVRQPAVSARIRAHRRGPAQGGAAGGGEEDGLNGPDQRPECASGRGSRGTISEVESRRVCATRSFVLPMQWRLSGTPVLPDATFVGALSAQLRDAVRAAILLCPLHVDSRRRLLRANRGHCRRLVERLNSTLSAGRCELPAQPRSALTAQRHASQNSARARPRRLSRAR